MHTLSAVITFLLILRNFGNAFGAVIGPRNEAVVSGDRMAMTCTVDSDHDFRSWTLERVSDRLEKTVYQFTDTRPSVEHFGIRKDSPGSYSLYANSTPAGDAGTFRCIVQSRVTKKLLVYSAQLVVIDSPPYCRTNLTKKSGEEVSLSRGELFFMQCSVRYHGSLNLTIEWKRTSAHDEPVVMDVKVVTSNDVTPSTLNVIADFTTPATYSWRVFFPPSSLPHSNVQNTTATNSPDYEYVWNSPLVLPVVPTGTARTTTTTTTTARDTDPSSPATPKLLPSAQVTEGSQGALLRVVSENWVIVMLGCIVFCFLITAGVACYCIKSRRRTNEQRMQIYRQMSACGSNQTGTSTNNETYDAIDDAIVYCDISHTARDVDPRRPSVSSPSSPGYATMMRRLPATPPASQPNNAASQRKPSSDRRNQSKPAKQAEARRKGVTIDRNKINVPDSNEALETAKSSSLPNLYNDIVAKPAPASARKPDVHSDTHGQQHITYGNVTAVSGSTCYITPDDITLEMDSTYLQVNELSKSGKDHQMRKPYLEELLNDPYLVPNLV